MVTQVVKQRRKHFLEANGRAGPGCQRLWDTMKPVPGGTREDHVSIWYHSSFTTQLPTTQQVENTVLSLKLGMRTFLLSILLFNIVLKNSARTSTQGEKGKRY